MLISEAFNSPGEAVSHSKLRIISANQMTDGQKTPTIFQRIAEADKTAVRECLDKHGNLVRALAKQITESHEEAENAAQEIFLDIWKLADRFDSAKQSETDFIASIARRWFLERMAQTVFAD